MERFVKELLFVLLLLLCATHVRAQFYPVQSTTQLIPPYSVYLSDYATGGNEKLRVILLQRDLTQPAYQLRLVLTVSLNGKVIMRTSRSFTPPPINLNPGIPTVISGSELAPYVDSRNIDFIGYSREQYERTKSLPEGDYQISFTAYDYRRQDVQVSNSGISFYFLTKNEPPLINFPACGTTIPTRTPQQIVFSWMPRNTSSPNSAADTQYELALYETRPKGRNPNDVVLSSQPVFKTIVDMPQLVYGPAEPLLLDSMRYVWRVRAIDRNGKDAFRNNGYSEVCTFTYGGIALNMDIGRVTNLRAEGETERRGRIWWDMDNFDSYQVNYRKTNGSYEWFTSKVSKEELTQQGKTHGEVKVFDLESDTEYEARVQVRKDGFLGPYTEIVTFRTSEHRVMQCGEGPNLLKADETNPLLDGIKGTLIQADGLEIQLMDVVHLGDGWYQGTGRTSVAYFGGAVFAVKFERLFIDANHVAGFGRIDFVTKGTAALVEQQLSNQALAQVQRIQKQNRDQWEGTVFYDKVLRYDDMIITDITVEGVGYVTITNSDGEKITDASVAQILAAVPGQAIIIEDKNGDQFVVQQDATTGQSKVTRVKGGGLSTFNTSEVTNEEMDIVRMALKELRKDYNDAKVAELQSNLNTAESHLQSYVDQENSKVVGQTVSTASSTFFTEMIEDTPPVVVDNEFEKRSISFKLKERSFNKAIIVKTFSQENRSKEEIKIIAQGLLIGNKSIHDYLADQKSNGKSETEMVAEVKTSLVQLIERILNEYVYDIK